MIWTQVSSSLSVCSQPRVVLIRLCISDNKTSSCWFVALGTWSDWDFFAITAPHRARRSSVPSAFAQSICAELARGWGFGSAGLQAAGRVFRQTEAPSGDASRGQNREQVSLLQSQNSSCALNTDRSSEHISWWKWVSPQLRFRVKQTAVVGWNLSTRLLCPDLLFFVYQRRNRQRPGLTSGGSW